MAFGKKNHVNLNPLSYNIMLLGESKVGKTSVIKEVCEKLVGDDGYIFLECGRERGADAIEGISYINCSEWSKEYDEANNDVGFYDVITDIIENKDTDYPNLKVVVIDTYDQLIDITEKEAIRLWNKKCDKNGDKAKKADSINGAWGGYGKGLEKVIDMMLSSISNLRKVGVSTIVIGHVKNKEIQDSITGESYTQITSDQTQKYFNAIKKELHFLGLAYIDREIIKARKNGKDTGKIQGETRKIKFRDDNYAIDSGSRFADIVPEINLNADEFIKALTDAIKAEQKKSGISMADAKKEQKKREAKEQEQIKKNKEQVARLEDMRAELLKIISENKSNVSMIKEVMTEVKSLGYDNPTEITKVEDAEQILAVVKDKI
mgnify:CR=1 FL=1